jgi:hypothetical protein
VTLIRLWLCSLFSYLQSVVVDISLDLGSYLERLHVVSSSSFLVCFMFGLFFSVLPVFLVISISFIFCSAKPAPWLSLPINSGLQIDTHYVGYCLSLTPTHCSELVSVGMVDMIGGNYDVTVAVAIEHACYC